jgi:hypothetical protein
MASTITVAVEGNPFLDGNKDVAKIVVDWVSHTDGTVSNAILTNLNSGKHYSAPAPGKIRGKIVKVETAPGASGDLTTDLPDSYALTLLDSYSLDVLGGSGAARSASAAEPLVPSLPVAVDSDLTVTITGAGSANKGRIIIWVDPMEV